MNELAMFIGAFFGVVPTNEEPSFVCPRCGARSHNPNDIEHGYCGRCHAFTRDVATPLDRFIAKAVR